VSAGLRTSIRDAPVFVAFSVRIGLFKDHSRVSRHGGCFERLTT